MGKSQYKIKSKHIICITLVLLLGFIGKSYAMWSDSHLIFNEIKTGFLDADVSVELFSDNAIIITEKHFIFDNSNNVQEEDKNTDSGQNIGNEDNIQDTSEEYIKTYHCNYDKIPFTIINGGTVPLRLEEYEIILNSVNISDIFSFEYEESYFMNEKLIVLDEANGHIQIDEDKLEELAELIQSDNDEIILKLYFKQSNLLFGGWTREKSVHINILKNIEIISNDDTNEDENNNEDDMINDNMDNNDLIDNNEDDESNYQVDDENNENNNNLIESINGGAGNES